jgi:hypothetical protein
MVETILYVASDLPDTVDTCRGYVLAKLTLALALNQNEMRKVAAKFCDLTQHVKGAGTDFYVTDIYRGG